MSDPVLTRVMFRKQVSDGNYGSETAECALDVPLGATISLALEMARSMVHAELARSPSGNVRRALEHVQQVRSNYDDDEDLPL